MPNVVVITGGSAGVGRATAQAFARAGYSVGVLARAWGLPTFDQCTASNWDRVNKSTQRCRVRRTSASSMNDQTYGVTLLGHCAGSASATGQATGVQTTLTRVN